MFQPQFDDHVYVGFQDNLQHLNPRLWATTQSAYELADVLKDLGPVVVMDSPLAFAPNSPFFFVQKVPFLKFPSGYRENAGALQMWWVRVPEPEGLAERYCRQQIAADEAAWKESQESV